MLYRKAGKHYKHAKRYQEAGENFIIASNLQLRIGENFDAATDRALAARSLRQCGDADLLAIYQKAAELSRDCGNMAQAAALWTELAEEREKQASKVEPKSREWCNLLRAAVAAYHEAALCLGHDEKSFAATEREVRGADVLAQLLDFSPAIAVYERVAETNADSSMLRWGVNGLLQKAALCQVATTLETYGPLHSDASATTDETEDAWQACEDCMEKYYDVHAQFHGSRESAFVTELMTAVKTADTDALTHCIKSYNQVLHLPASVEHIVVGIQTSVRHRELEASDLR